MSLKRGRAWTKEEVETLRKLRRDGVSLAAIGRHLNRSISSVSTKVDYLLNNPKGATIRRGAQRDCCPDKVFADRDIRANAPHRDLTGYLLGDPPVGFSALERR